MSLELIKYGPSHFQKWDEFIRNSINGNFLHTRNFYDSNPANENDDCSLLFLKKNKIIAALPATMRDIGSERILNSHSRSTYGGVIIGTVVGMVEAVEIVRLIIEYARINDVTEIIIRNPFKILYNQISDEIDYALWYHNFLIKSREAEIYVDLTPEIAIIKKRYENGTKYNIKKALKSISVKVDENFENFWTILIKNLEGRYAKKPVHSLADINLLRQKVGGANIILFAGFQEEVLVAGCIVFVFNNTIHAQYIAQDDAFQDVRPVNAVLDYIIDWGKENGFKYFNLGTANEGGKVMNEGLFHFKESFGGRAVLRETMNLNLKNE